MLVVGIGQRSRQGFQDRAIQIDAGPEIKACLLQVDEGRFFAMTVFVLIMVLVIMVFIPVFAVGMGGGQAIFRRLTANGEACKATFSHP